jgi:hypothetical protein
MPVLAFVLTRLGIAALAYFTSPILQDSTVPPYHLRPDNVLLDALTSRWDSGFYLDIAREGYRNAAPAGQFPSTPFFPLYPVLIRLFDLAIGDTLVAGLLVANLALLLAVMFFHRLAGEEFGDAVADRAVWYLLIFPSSFFGSAVYSESLFLLLSILALYQARRQRWLGAGAAGLLTAMTRFVGLLVGVMLLVEWLQQRLQKPQAASHSHDLLSTPAPIPVIERKPAWPGLFAAVLVPLGTLGYMLYLQFRFGDALAFLHASQAWGRTPASPLEAVADLFIRPLQGWGNALAAGALPLDNWLDLFFVLGFLPLGIVLLTQKRWSEGVYVVIGVLLPFNSGLLMSQRRYVWVLFPAFLLLARWGENPWVDRIIFVFSLLGLGVFTALFANWYWVG